MMPLDGRYTRKTISKEEAKKIFLKHKNDYESYIGYLNSAKILSEHFGLNIGLNRDRTIIKQGDIILTFALNYRINDVETKKVRKHGDNIEDYYFCLVTFDLT
jgi:hypothetical protein